MVITRINKPYYLLILCFLSLVADAKNFARREEVLKDLIDKDRYFEGENDNGQPQITAEDLPKNGEIFEGDMVMDSGLRRFVLGLDTKRSAIKLAEEGQKRHWKDGIVPYVFDEDTLPIIKERIHDAIKNFNCFTCIRYIPKRELDEDYVIFTSGGKPGCSSSVGKQGGKQRIHLTKHCSRIGTVMHEMMHCLGIVHEQSRPDRDDHVKVKFDNIKSKLTHNFRKYDWYTATNLDVPYNFYSVMHYSNKAFSRNGQDTLSSRSDPDLKFGQREFLTQSDVLQINKLYHCDDVDYDDDNLIRDMTDDVILQEKREKEEEEEEEKEAAGIIYASVLQDL